MQPIEWRKSTYSGDGSNCVEIIANPNIVKIRDSKNTEGPHLAFPPFAWTSFISHTMSNSGHTRLR